MSRKKAAAGRPPARRKSFLASGNDRASQKKRKLDLYETPPEATHALMKHENLPQFLWECACGPGAIVKILRAAGHVVYATDVRRRKGKTCPHSERADFLKVKQRRFDVLGIVTNPPYFLADRFIEHAIFHAPYVAMLLRYEYFTGHRGGLLDRYPPSRVLVFVNRLPRMHRAGYRGKKAASRMAFAWFVWDKSHTGPTTHHRITWEKL